jgi:hypothetical protein
MHRNRAKNLRQQIRHRLHVAQRRMRSPFRQAIILPERLQLAVARWYRVKKTLRQSVAVHEVFRGQTAWKGFVEVFTLTGHPKAKKAYAWSHPEGPHDHDERFVTVLEIPPVDSPQAAVKVAIAAGGRKP